MLTALDGTRADWCTPNAVGIYSRRIRLLLQLVLALAALSLAVGPAHALDKTANGITVDVNLPHARRGVPYEFQIAPSGQIAPYSFELTAGSLPTGFSLSSSGLVTGESCVAANGTYKFGVRITAANGESAEFDGAREFSLNMTAGPCREDDEGVNETDTGDGDTGEGDTGEDNTGDEDTGDTEEGDTGETDTGDGDTGETDTGDGDTGDGDTGEGDTGEGDTDDGDTEEGDTGEDNTGDEGTGDPEDGGTEEGDTGETDTGDGDTGVGDTGEDNTGDEGTGDPEEGDTGEGDTGDEDTGDTGDSGEDDTADTEDGDTGEGDTGEDDTDTGDTDDGDTGYTNDPANPEEPNETGDAAEIRALDGEIVIDLSASRERTGAIDLAGLTSVDASAGPVTFEVIAQPSNGSISLDGSVLTYTPSDGASGDTVHYVAAQGSTRSNSAKIVIRILRAPLSDDRQLLDVARLQFDAAAGAAFLQLDNIANHLEGAAWDERCAIDNGVRVRPATAESVQSAGTAEAQADKTRSCLKGSRVRAWAAGTITIDDEDGSVSSDGLTAGIEASLSSSTSVGIAAGVTRSDFRISQQGSSSLSSVSAAMYGHWRPARRVHLSGTLAYTDVDLELGREIGTTDQIGRSSREGSVWSASLRAAAEADVGKLTVSGYARGGVANVKLDAASEDAGHPLAVRFSSARQTHFNGKLGATLRLPFELGRGTLSPFARLEHRWNSRGEFVQEVEYSRAPSEAGFIRGDKSSDGSSSLGLGVRYQAGSFTAMGEYRIASEPGVALGGGVLRLYVGTVF